jgi:hypothetical protein
MLRLTTARVAGVAATTAALACPAAAAAEMDWLALCGKCLSPSIISKSGIGTANAVAEGRITRRDAEGWCANWSPGDPLDACVRRELASADARKTYRATADCTKGRITAIDGVTYTLAGKWTNDVGKGRTKWRDPSGNVVGQDHASNGLAISQQWEVLCPVTAKASTAPSAAPAAPAKPRRAPNGQFAVGEMVDAKYGRDWVRGRVSAVRQVTGRSGPELAYDVRLENGQRGILPAGMLRKLPGN